MISLAYIILLLLVAIFAPWVARSDPLAQDLNAVKQPPSASHWFGTDALGRDIFSRIVWGTRVALKVGAIANVVAISIGIVMGALGGYFRGWVDQVVIFLYTVIWAFPDLLFIIALTIALPPVGEPSISKVYFAIGLAGWTSICRLVRSQFITLREREYVEAARALGASSFRIVFLHILPNTLGIIVLSLAAGFSGAIMAEAGLSFLGLGVQPPAPSWGAMVYEGYNYLQSQWWMVAFPAVAVALAVFAFNLLADGLRDALDPRMLG